MRIKFIERKTRKAAVRNMPWAAKIVKVESGYMGFESLADYLTWRKQK